MRSHLLNVLGLLGMAACGNEIMAPGLYDRRVTIADDGDRDGGDSGPSGGDPAPGDTSPPTPIVTALVAASAVTQSAFAGAEVDDAPAVFVRDQFGNPMAGQAVHFTLEAGGGVLDPAFVTTDAQGRATVTTWALGKRVAPNQVRARLDSAPAIAPVTFDATILTDYTITVRFLTSVTTSQRAAFENAAARWSAVIVGDLENFQISRSQLPFGCARDTADTTLISVDDTIIFASVQPIDGQGGILAQAAPCAQHDLGGIAVGVMSFDSDDLEFLESNNVLEGTILHEMGHVVGIGSLWAINGLVISPSIGSPGANTRFTGDDAAQAFVDIGGTGFTGTVPVENNGVAGSADAHWRESIFSNELMSPAISGMEPSLPMSAVTVASLRDIGGYEINDLAADTFAIVQALTAAGPQPPPLGECHVVSPSEEHPLGGGLVELR
ncbi:MAG: leishmanolysin-related zinc metalloendopeptidase [Myxococcota bacterium]